MKLMLKLLLLVGTLAVAGIAVANSGVAFPGGWRDAPSGAELFRYLDDLRIAMGANGKVGGILLGGLALILVASRRCGRA